MLSAAWRYSRVRRHSAISFYCFSLGYFSHDKLVYKTALSASRWSALLAVAGLSRCIPACRGGLTFMIMKKCLKYFCIYSFLYKSLEGNEYP